jgi:hypothetical protein
VASPNPWDGGIGGSIGPEWATSKPLHHTGSVWYVHSVSGADAAAPRGKERIRPLQTTAQAFTNSAAGDFIVWLDGHVETLTASQVLSKARLKLLAEGVVRITRNFNGILFDITADDVYIEGAYIPASLVASSSPRIRTANARTEIVGCYLEHGSNDTGAGIQLVTGWSGARIMTSSFVSVALTPATAPDSAIHVLNAGTRLDLYKNTFDGGLSGWLQPYAFNGAAAVTELRATKNNQLNDSDGVMATGSSGFRFPGTTTPGRSSRWDWPA